MAADGDPSSTPLSSTLPPRRVVLLGASNLTRGISTIVDTARRIWGAPLEVFAALGHGRSYGLTSAVLARKLPGILQCGLWDALSAIAAGRHGRADYRCGQRHSLRCAGRVDSRLGRGMRRAIGGRRTRRSCSRCRRRPRSRRCRSGATRSSARCAFPGCRLSRNDAFSRAEQLDAGLQELAARRGLRAVRPRSEWYGFDPIHIRRRHWPIAWNEVLSAWRAETGETNLARFVRAVALSAIARCGAARIFGIEQRAAQPCGRLRDGTTIAIY